eukprot:g456.t1
MHTSTRTGSFPQGSLFSTTYGPKTLRIGMKSQPDDIFRDKPCVGSVDLGVDRNEDCLRTTLRRNEGTGRIGRAAQTILWDDPRENRQGPSLFQPTVTARQAEVYDGAPPMSDKGRRAYRRHEMQQDVVYKPNVGNVPAPLVGTEYEKYHQEHQRLDAKFSPASRTIRRGCIAATQSGMDPRKPNGRPFSNVTLACPPQRGGLPEHEDQTHWHYKKSYNTSHGAKDFVAHRSEGGRYYNGSGVIDQDTMLQTKTEGIKEREFFDIGCKPRMSGGQPYTKATKAREDALLAKRGRLTVQKDIPADIMQATREAHSQMQNNIFVDDKFNPSIPSDNSAYVELSSQWQSMSSVANSFAQDRLTNFQKKVSDVQVREAQLRTSLFRR